MQSFNILEFLTGPATQPFAIAESILIGLTILEAIALTIGSSLSAKLDAVLHLDHADGDAAVHDGISGDVHDGVFGTVWDWLNKGRVPLLIFIMILLGAFGAAGYAIQGVAHALVGYLPVGITSVIAFLLAIPATRRTTQLVSRIVPRDETYVISNEDLIGSVGTVTLGPVTMSEIGRLRLLDRHGNQHFPWARGANESVRVDTGAPVLIVGRKDNEYLVIAAEERA